MQKILQIPMIGASGFKNNQPYLFAFYPFQQRGVTLFVVGKLPRNLSRMTIDVKVRTDVRREG